MSNRAWMPLHIEAYMADTLHLSAAEHGAYMLLVMHTVRKGALPSTEKLLAKFSRTTDDEWAAMRDRVMTLFLHVDERGYAASDRHLGRDRKRRIPNAVRIEVTRRDGHRCVYCGSMAGPFHLDHKMPWSRGGRHTPENLCVACKNCNEAKGALTAEEFGSAIQ